ncbi:Ras-GEF domain-containing protein [Plasmodiophora brassicae]
MGVEGARALLEATGVLGRSHRDLRVFLDWFVYVVAPCDLLRVLLDDLLEHPPVILFKAALLAEQRSKRSLDAPVDLLADLFLTRNLQILSFVETWAACYAGDFTGHEMELTTCLQHYPPASWSMLERFLAVDLSGLEVRAQACLAVAEDMFVIRDKYERPVGSPNFLWMPSCRFLSRRYAFDRLPAGVIADQMCVHMRARLSEITPRDLIGPGRLQAFASMSDRIVIWVASEILLRRSRRQRRRAVSKWVAIAMHCLRRCNFHSACEIAAALTVHPLRRLRRELFETLPGRRWRQFVQLQQLISDHDKFGTYRRLYAHAQPARFRIPCIASVVRDIRVHEDMLVSGQDVVKRCIVGQHIARLALDALRVCEQDDYWIKPDRDVQYALGCRRLASATSIADLMERSMSIEPIKRPAKCKPPL